MLCGSTSVASHPHQSSHSTTAIINHFSLFCLTKLFVTTEQEGGSNNKDKGVKLYWLTRERTMRNF